jgi:hypothetical protein
MVCFLPNEIKQCACSFQPFTQSSHIPFSFAFFLMWLKPVAFLLIFSQINLTAMDFASFIAVWL